jgi:uncharacterized protein with ACT and thioredoxin-like domain
MTLVVADKPGVLSKITSEIAQLGGDIIALGTFYSEPKENAVLMIKVKGVPKDKLVTAMNTINAQVSDIRDL